jgi:hypothetical protein
MEQEMTHMTTSPTDRTTNPHRPRDTSAAAPANPFAPYGVALYSIAGIGLAAGVALNWHALAAAGIIPFLLFLPCILMMLMCMKHGGRTEK